MEIEAWFRSIPIITRTYLVLAVVTAVAVTYNLITPLSLYFSWRHIMQKGEWWRLISCFVFFDELSVNFFFHMHFVYVYCRRLEEHFYFRRTGEFLTLLLIGAAMLLGLTFVIDMPFPSYSFVIMVLYLWSRRYPDERMSIYGLFAVSAPYLAYFMLFLSYMMGSTNSMLVDLVGILVGHLLWFTSDIFPLISGIDVMKGPRFLYGFFVPPADGIDAAGRAHPGL